MAKATIAKLTYATRLYGMNFKTTEGLEFIVRKFSNNVLEIEPSLFSTAYDMAKIVAGCFESRSTFAGVKQVTFTFNGKKVSVKKEENATPEMIYMKWYNDPYEE